MTRIPGIGLLAAVLLTLTIRPCVVKGEDAKPVREVRAKVDSPFGLVAFASVDRVMARATAVGEALGQPDESTKLLTILLDDEHEQVSKFLNSPGLDRSRPFGAMSFPHWFEPTAEHQPKPTVGDLKESLKDWQDISNPLAILEILGYGFVTNSTVAICLPVKDRALLLKSVCDLANIGEELPKVEGHPEWYQFDKNENVRLGFVGNYLYVVAGDSSAGLDLNFPEFDKLAKSSLGKSGFVYALYRRGLPQPVRDSMVPALKMAAAATLQRRDDEPELDFRTRTMFGELQTEWIDALLSHVDEFRITGHVDSATLKLSIESELVGTKGGKFAKRCNELSARPSPFGHLTDNTSLFSCLVSVSLPAKQWKPVSDAIYEAAKEVVPTERSEGMRLIARTIESGQLDLYAVKQTPSKGLVGLRVPMNAKLPDQFQQMMGEGVGGFDVAIDSVNGFPIHRSLAEEYQVPPLLILHSTCLSAMTMSEEEEIKALASATQDSIWLGLGEEDESHEWFKSTMIAASVKPGKSDNKRGQALVQLTSRGLLALSMNLDLSKEHAKGSEVQQTGGKNESNDRSPDEGAAKTISNPFATILRQSSDAIRCEILPTETGIKLGLTFEEAYFLCFAEFAKQQMEHVKTAKKPKPARPKAGPANGVDSLEPDSQ